MDKQISNENETNFALLTLFVLKEVEHEAGICDAEIGTDLKSMVEKARKRAHLRTKKHEGDYYVTEITIPFTGNYAKELLKLFRKALQSAHDNMPKPYKRCTPMRVEENNDESTSTYTLTYYFETPLLKTFRALGYDRLVDGYIKRKKALPKAAGVPFLKRAASAF